MYSSESEMINANYSGTPFDLAVQNIGQFLKNHQERIQKCLEAKQVTLTTLTEIQI